jgi:ATP-dependent DNA ligase
MLARPDRLPRGDYSFEVKWDGFRAIVAPAARGGGGGTASVS